MGVLPIASSKFLSSPIIPPTIQRYERLELMSGLLGSRAFSILLLLQLLTKQNWWSYWCFVAFFPRGVRKIFKSRTLKSITSYNQHFFCTKVCLQNARPPFICSILEMYSRRRRPSPGSEQRCLIARRMSRELCITKACSTFLKSSELRWLPRKLENSLPGNTMETCSCSQYLLIVGRTPVTIRFSSLSVGLQRWYTSYSLILVIVNQLSKILCDEPV